MNNTSICIWCDERKVRGAHNVCELCWKWHIYKQQDRCCFRCGNDPPGLDSFKWSEYDVNDAKKGELVCKPCHRKMSRRKQLLINKRVNENLVTGRDYHDKLIKCGVDGETAMRIFAELDEATKKHIVDKAKHAYSGLATQDEMYAGFRAYAHSFRRHKLATILIREGLQHVAKRLRLPHVMRKRKRDATSDGPPVMNAADCAMLGLPAPEVKTRKPVKQTQKPKTGVCGFCGTDTELESNGLCASCAEMVM